MGKNTKIEWCDHTWNPWRGCTKVSSGCANCYAEKLSHRNPKSLGVWGDNGTRVIASESGWKEPLKWDRLAKEAGERHRVFCASLADIFEDRKELRKPRLWLFDLIRLTPNLDWLLLTKRPENIQNMIHESLILSQGGNPDDKNYFADRDGSFPENDLAEWLNDWSGDEPPVNVWLGCSAENQQTANERIPHLLRCPAAVRFLSCEPMLGPINLPWIDDSPMEECRRNTRVLSTIDYVGEPNPPKLHWVIVGGESGPGARPMHPDWARSLRDQCQASGVPFFFKQWGEWIPFPSNRDIPDAPESAPVCLVKPDGRVIRPYAQIDAPGHQMCRVGKHAAGRLLDGREWNEMPAVEVAR